MILLLSGYGSFWQERRPNGLQRACMAGLRHFTLDEQGFGVTYRAVTGLDLPIGPVMAAPQGACRKGSEYEHRAIYRQ
jgi:uncharacterized protein YceK